MDSLGEDGIRDGDSTPASVEIPETDSSPEYNFKISNLKVDELVKTPKGHKKKNVNNKKSNGAKGSQNPSSSGNTNKGKDVTINRRA